MQVVTCIDDLREMAKKRVARAIFEYVDCGAYSEGTLRANRADIEAIGLRQRVGIDVDKRSTKTTLLGREAAMPLALAPGREPGVATCQAFIETFVGPGTMTASGRPWTG